MPRRSYTSRRARRPYRRTRVRRSGAIRIRRNTRMRRFRRYISPGLTLGAFPQRKTVAIRYIDDLTLDASAGGIAKDIYNVTSVYDPYVAAGGHQPMFHDTYSLIYEKYKVNYATIRFVALSTHCVNTTSPSLFEGTNVTDTQYFAANERACRMFILKDSSTSDLPANLNTLIEEGARNLKWKYCPQTTNGSIPSVKMSCAPHKLLGLSRNDDQLNSLVSGNPPTACYFIVGVEGLGGGFNPDSMKFQVIITYNVTYYELKKNQSQN